MIEDLDHITIRVARILNSVGTFTVADLVARTEDELLCLPGFSRKNLFELRDALRDVTQHCEGCRRGYPKNASGQHVWPSGIGGGDYRACTTTAGEPT